jgi:hypothetical protein
MCSCAIAGVSALVTESLARLARVLSSTNGAVPPACRAPYLPREFAHSDDKPTRGGPPSAPSLEHFQRRRPFSNPCRGSFFPWLP